MNFSMYMYFKFRRKFRGFVCIDNYVNISLLVELLIVYKNRFINLKYL